MLGLSQIILKVMATEGKHTNYLVIKLFVENSFDTTRRM